MLCGSSPIGIIAGNGTLPFEVARLLNSRGYDCYLLGIRGEVGDEIINFDHHFISWGRIGRLVRLFRRRGVRDILLLGGVRRRPRFFHLCFDIGLWSILPRVFRMLSLGDNRLLLACIDWFEEKGFRVRSLSDIAPELIISGGDTLGKRPSKDDLRRISYGLSAVRALSDYDIGQGAIVVGERVIAIEGIEGTDEMLDRVRRLRDEGRLPKKGGVLVKCLKVGQDSRADLPTIGPRTIHNIHEAGLSGIGVESGHTVIVEREETLSLVRRFNLFIHGITE